MWRSLLYTPFFFAGLASIVGLGSALAEIRQQSYWALGFDRNLKIAVWDHTTNWLILGLLCSAVYGVLSLVVVAVSRAIEKREREPRPGFLYVIALAAGMVILAGSPEYSALLRWGLALTVLVWCACLFASQALRHNSRLWLAARGLRLATLAIPSLLAARALLGPSGLSTLVRQPEVMAGCLLSLFLAIWILARPAERGGAFDPLRDARLWPTALPWFLLLVSGLGTLGLSHTLRAGNPRNVLLIGVDTLRLDRTSLADTEDPLVRTPRLGSWSAQGTVFTTAISQAPWTMPSFASVFTGKYPRQHGAVSLYGFLRKSETTIAEILRESGYWTGAVVSHVYVDSHHGFAQGFNLYDEDNVLGHWEITSEAVTDRAIELLNKHGDEPFFIFLHYFDPHFEYRDHVAEYYADDYTGWLREVSDIEGLRKDRHLLSEEDVDFLRHLYDEEIAFTDAQIGRVLDRLKELRLENDTAVVFVSDHGEEFLERGWLGHTIHLYDELIRVPLVLALPNITDRVPIVHDPVETRAILATLLEYLEIDLDSFDRSPSLLAAIRGDVEGPGITYSEVWLPDASFASGKRFQISMLRTKKWKLIRDHGRDFVRLYDLETDPGETRDASLEETDLFADLDARMSRWLETMSDQPRAPTADLTPDLKEKLRALGYLDDQ